MTENDREKVIERIVNSRLSTLSLEDLMEMFKDKESEFLSRLPSDELEEIHKDLLGYSYDE